MLRRAIRSVLGQSFPDFRVCVYDNASGDETGAVVEEFRGKDSRVEYICRANNIGAHGNFVDGADRVETPYFSFLADDDLMLPDFLQTALAGFRRYPGAALSILPTLCMSPRGHILHMTNLKWPEGLLLPPSGMLSTIAHGNPGLQAMLIRKAVWDEFGGFDEATVPGDEYDFDLRVMARRPVVVSKKPGAIQVMHSGAYTAMAGFNWVWPCVPRMISKIAQNTDLHPAVREQAVENMTRSMKWRFIKMGLLEPISRGDWGSAQEAADIMMRELPQSRAARTARVAAMVCQKLPGTPFIGRAILALRTGERSIRNLGLQWQFRAYSSFLRAFSVEGSVGTAA
jgi:glycosyltransferase involved in cell wall biosynthesis